MTLYWRPAGHISSCERRISFRCSWSIRLRPQQNSTARRTCFHSTSRSRAVGEGAETVADAAFWKEYRASITSPLTSSRWSEFMSLSHLETTVTARGNITDIRSISGGLCFATLYPDVSSDKVMSIQIVCHGRKLCDQLRSIRRHSAVHITGELVKKQEPKGIVVEANEKQSRRRINIRDVEVKVFKIVCLNSVPADLNLYHDQNYSPKSRHLQIRFDDELRKRLWFRSKLAHHIRKHLSKGFQEIETPILFKSSAEGAREFLVPTRKPGHAYALPQSPQQYKQILMASGIRKYFQFAKCFRDEDLRADRQPEFTQLDIEMAFENGEGVMISIEQLIKHSYAKFVKPAGPIEKALPDSNFIRMPYQEAMSNHGSDKPDLRIKGLIHRIDDIFLNELAPIRSMLTSLQDPIIEVCKLRLNGTPADIQGFLRNFMDSPDAEPFTSNIDGAPGFCIYDSRKPLEGLQTFGFEGAESLKTLFSKLPRKEYQDEETHAANTTFENGDLLIIQARQNLPHQGGATVLGKLRLALYKAAVSQSFVTADPTHHYLWVTEFPMFTPNNGTDPGQGGSSGFSATHHPFTAPLTPEDVDLLLTEPLKAKADHYDLVVNGVELGGGSRRIHNAEMQKFVMRDIIKMSEERIDDFSHLFEALRAGCPPHAGLAIGFDRLVAVMCGVESVKDVIAFPKSSKGEDMMVGSPARMTDVELGTYGLQLKSRNKEEVVPKESDEISSVEEMEEMKSEPPSQA